MTRLALPSSSSWSPRHNGHVLNLLSPVTESRRFHRGGKKNALNLVDNQRREGLSFKILGNDQQGAVRFSNLLKEWKEILEIGDLLLVDEDDWILEDHLHFFGIGHKIGRKVAAIKLHAFDYL